MTVKRGYHVARVLGAAYVYMLDEDGDVLVKRVPMPTDLAPAGAVNNPIPSFKGKVMVYGVNRDAHLDLEHLDLIISKVRNQVGEVEVLKRVYKGLTR